MTLEARLGHSAFKPLQCWACKQGAGRQLPIQLSHRHAREINHRNNCAYCLPAMKYHNKDPLWDCKYCVFHQQWGWHCPKKNVPLLFSMQRMRQGSTSFMPLGRTLKWCFVVLLLFPRNLSSTSALICARAERSQLQVNISSCTLKVGKCQATGCYKWEIPRLMDFFFLS